MAEASLVTLGEEKDEDAEEEEEEAKNAIPALPLSRAHESEE